MPKKMKPNPSKSGTAQGGVAATHTTPQIRSQMIAEAAYYRALNRGFNGGDPVEDWLQAEREIDNFLLCTGAGRGETPTARPGARTASRRDDRLLPLPVPVE